MKKTAIFLCALFLLLLCTSAVSASPLYYTFTGEITNISDGGGIIADAGLEYGSSVEYVFMVDFDLPGQYTQNNGDVYTYTDASPNNYFYADLISGSLIESEDGFFTADDDVAEYNWGTERALTYNGVTYGGYGSVDGDSIENLTFITCQINGLFSEWEVGDTNFRGQERAIGSNGWSSYYATLTLTGISDTNTIPSDPVPGPATMLLLGAGLIGTAGVRRRTKK